MLKNKTLKHFNSLLPPAIISLPGNQKLLRAELQFLF
jgi:hypothetical protein